VATPTELLALPPDIDPPPHAPSTSTAANATILIFMIDTPVNATGANAGNDLSISITTAWQTVLNVS
jgi:hypothetical protein